MAWKDPNRIKEWRREHKEELKQKAILYREKNKDKLREKQKEYQETANANQREWYKRNKSKVNVKSRKYYLEHIEEVKQKAKEYAEKNKEFLSQQKRNYYLENREALLKNRAEYVASHPNELKNYYEANKELIRVKNKLKYLKNKKKLNKQRAKLLKKQRKTDINFKILCNLRTRFYMALKRNTKSKRTIELLGCSIEFFKKYLESQFKEGMTWENYGEGGWVIDHIRPCASFDLRKESEQMLCEHYSNKQPLWEADNLIKRDKII
jgi:hypothetical protein